MSEPLEDLLGNSLSNPLEQFDDPGLEVVDDRPEEDKVEPRDEGRSSQDSDEIENLGGRAGKRIGRLKYEFHEERRHKEAAMRMQEEAVRYAQQMEVQNRELRSVLERGEKVLLSEIHSRTDSELSSAKERYKLAYESGDSESIVEAQEELSRSVVEKDQASKYQPVVEGQNRQQAMQQQYAMQQRAMQQQAMQQQAMQQQAMQQQSARKQPVDPKLAKWMAQNEWFGKDPERTQFAYGVHERLVADGLDPTTDEYYERIDDRVGEIFPGTSAGTGTEGPAEGRGSTTVVAPARRAGGRPRKVQLTSTQVSLAKRLGITPEQYAKQLMKEN